MRRLDFLAAVLLAALFTLFWTVPHVAAHEASTMARPNLGSVKRHGDHWDIRITLADGTRSNRMHQPPGMSEAKAREKAAHLSVQAKKIDPATLAPVAKPAPAAPLPAGETFASWSVRWCLAREAAGHTTVDDDRGRLRKWILPELGAMAMDEITRQAIERWVEVLDGKVRAGALHWKTAANVFGLLTKAFDDACRSKTVDLQILTANPLRDPVRGDVRGPDRGVKKSKVFLFPAELGALLACEDVPATWRRMYALATYLYVRAAEVRALEWGDVDFERRIVTVRQTETDGKKGTTKSEKTRRVPIEPALLPLLLALHEQAGGEGRVLPRMPGEKRCAPMLREHLVAAGLTRAELFAKDATRKNLRFHDLRASGITYRAARGDSVPMILKAAGHEDFKTTLGYIGEAEGVKDGFGEVFAALPAALVSPNVSPEWVGANGHAYKTRQKRVGEAGFEPSLDGGKPLVSKPLASTTDLVTYAANAGNPPEVGSVGATGRNPVSVNAPRISTLGEALLVAVGQGDVDAARGAWRELGALLGEELP